LVRGRANPNGAGDAAVYLLRGDATAGPITEIVPAEGVMLPIRSEPLPHPVRLTLLHFNDFHGRLATFPRLAGWLTAARQRAAADPHHIVLAVTAGDEIGGNLSDALLGGDLAMAGSAQQTHPTYRLYAQAGVDVGVPGNHDLDLGAARLAHAIGREARFPILAANLTGSPALAECCYPAAIFTIEGLRIGCIGLTTPAQVHPEPASGRRVTDPIVAAQNLIPALRPLCDVLIIVSHLGFSLGSRSAVVEGAGDVELAASLPPGTVHLIIGGHTHTILNEADLSPQNIVNGIPIVQAGKFGQFVGEVEISVSETVEVTHARLRATIDLPEDAAFAEAHVRPLLAQVAAHGRRVLGTVAADDDLSADAVRNRFVGGESAFANFVADALAARCRTAGHPVDFAMIDATSINDGLRPAAALTFGDWFDVMPFADTVCLLRLTGRALAALLADNAWRVERPGEPHTYRGFLHFSQEVRYAIRRGPARPAATAEGITVDGRPIAACPERVFVIATTSFVRGPAAAWEAHAGAHFPEPLFDLAAASREHTPLTVRELLLAHIAAHGGVLPEGGARRDGRVRVLA
jgi:2',3'-cyclic-nucleotide 2'-phosphodiesterase (5'-nucleotidase family)